MKIRKMERNIIFESSPDGFTVLIGGKIFTRFIARNSLPKPIFYPVCTPSGISVTRRVPEIDGGDPVADHPHHRGLWCGHGSVNGCDFWEEYRPDHGIIRIESVSYNSESTIGHIAMTALWEDAEGSKILREHRKSRIFGVGDANIMDIDISLSPVGLPVTFGDTKEGGLVAVRLAPMMIAENTGRIFNADGLVYSAKTPGPETTWGKRSRWCAYGGQPVDGQSATVAIIHRPGGFRFPTWWHVRAYGLFAANPFGQSFFESDATPPPCGDFIVHAGESLSTSYRIIVADGDLSPTRISELEQL
jgi:hypothetical protein